MQGSRKKLAHVPLLQRHGFALRALCSVCVSDSCPAAGGVHVTLCNLVLHPHPCHRRCLGSVPFRLAPGWQCRLILFQCSSKALETELLGASLARTRPGRGGMNDGRPMAEG